jgi:hypothetical protein
LIEKKQPLVTKVMDHLKVHFKKPISSVVHFAPCWALLPFSAAAPAESKSPIPDPSGRIAETKARIVVYSRLIPRNMIHKLP